MNSGLLLLAALNGSGGRRGGTVDGGDAGGLALSLLSADVTVDQGVDNHIAGGEGVLTLLQVDAGDGDPVLLAVDVVHGVVVGAVSELHAVDIQAGAVGGHLGNSEDGLEDVVRHAVVVVVDDLQTVAQAVRLNLLAVLLDLQVGSNEVFPADIVGDIVAIWVLVPT